MKDHLLPRPLYNYLFICTLFYFAGVHIDVVAIHSFIKNTLIYILETQDLKSLKEYLERKSKTDKAKAMVDLVKTYSQYADVFEDKITLLQLIGDSRTGNVLPWEAVLDAQKNQEKLKDILTNVSIAHIVKPFFTALSTIIEIPQNLIEPGKVSKKKLVEGSRSHKV